MKRIVGMVLGGRPGDGRPVPGLLPPEMLRRRARRVRDRLRPE